MHHMHACGEIDAASQKYLVDAYCLSVEWILQDDATYAARLNCNQCHTKYHITCNTIPGMPQPRKLMSASPRSLSACMSVSVREHMRVIILYFLRNLKRLVKT